MLQYFKYLSRAGTNMCSYALEMFICTKDYKLFTVSTIVAGTLQRGASVNFPPRPVSASWSLQCRAGEWELWRGGRSGLLAHNHRQPHWFIPLWVIFWEICTLLNTDDSHSTPVCFYARYQESPSCLYCTSLLQKHRAVRFITVSTNLMFPLGGQMSQKKFSMEFESSH